MHQELASTLHSLAAARTEADHRRVINATTPTAGKALTRVALELHRQGLGPGTPLAHAQLSLLAHPDSTHADFKKVAADQHGEGLGNFLKGLAKGIFGGIATVGKAIFGHPAAQTAAKELASAAAMKAATTATSAFINRVNARR